MHHTSSHASGRAVLSYFKLCISRHKFFNYVWICSTPRLGSCIGVSCSLIAISKVLAWVDSFYYDNAVLRCGISDATNHVWCFPSVKVMLASRIIPFSLWSSSHEVSPGSIAISLNPMIDYVSNFGLLNSLFSTAWISAIPRLGFSLECLIYHVSVRSCKVLTNISFFILSSMTPYTSHTTFTTNQNWSGSSFPTPLNTATLLR